MVEPKKKKKPLSVQLSHVNMKDASQANKKAINRMWYVAPTCPLFIKKVDKKKPIPKGLTKRPIRANRCFGNHTFGILASQAGANVSKILAAESEALRCDTTGEDAKYPILPSFTKSAILALEAQLVAYCQLCFHNAMIFKNGQLNEKTNATLHSKVTSRAMQMAVDSANDTIAAYSTFGPGALAPMIPAPKPATAAKKKPAAAPTAEA